MTTNHDKVLNKIRALLAKTIENGCTEAEAMAALDMAQSMMDAYDITEDELQQTKTEEVIKRNSEWKTDPHNIKQCLGVSIGYFTDCKAVLDRRNFSKNKKGVMVFYGLPSDTDFAIWLLDTLGYFVFAELAKHLRVNKDQIFPFNKDEHIRGFVRGCTNRISKRLNDLKDASKVKSNNQRNALTVIKHDLIEKKMKELGVKLGTSRLGGRVEANSYKAGQQAGDNASFGRPVEQGGVLRIGKV